MKIVLSNFSKTLGISQFWLISLVIGNPFPLKQNKGKSFQGSIVLGNGFVLTPEEAQRLIAKDSRNKDVLFPYLNGEDLNNDPEQKPSRWVINFFDWPEEKARSYPDCFQIVVNLVKRERMIQNDKGGREKWWQFLRPRNELYETISKLDQVMAIALTSKTVAVALLPSSQVFSHSLGVFSDSGFSTFSYLQSTMHNIWAWTYGSSMKSDLRYTPSVCFETFPFPINLSPDQINMLNSIGKKYYESRKTIMQTIPAGLTKTYNLFHCSDLKEIGEDDIRIADDPFEKRFGKESLWLKRNVQPFHHTAYNEIVAQVFELRSVHREMDAVVLDAYGWNDIQLNHGFYEMGYLPENDRIRFTIQSQARKEILKRLLELNRQVYSGNLTVNSNSAKRIKKVAIRNELKPGTLF